MSGHTTSAKDHRTLLSARQQAVLDHLITGCTEEVVAQRLELSLHTVHHHAKTIYRKYGVHSRPELLSKFLQFHSGRTSQ